jgi:hypothetical protein
MKSKFETQLDHLDGSLLSNYLENEDSKDFDKWLKQNMAFSLKDFAGLGDIQLTNTQFSTMNGETIPVKGMVRFRVTPLDDEGNAYELEDMGYGDKDNAGNSKSPYGRPSIHAGKKYKITKDEFQKLYLFPSQPQGPGIGGLPGI